MPTIAWILVGGVAMAAIGLVGAVTLVLSDAALERTLLPLVALAAGSLLGGALFHLLPEAVDELGNDLDVYAAVAVGFVAFFLLEQFLHWQHSHAPGARREPVGYLVLLADSVHNLLDGLAVGGAFVIDAELGMVAWLVTAAHEIPQELGDFAVLVRSGWTRRAALAFNVASGLLFLVGALVAYAASRSMEVALLVPFAAGTFIYIAASDLLPQLRSEREPTQFGAFLGGVACLLALALLG